jgi:2-hydroxychromene-2-carboxylate isomerase
MGELVSLAERRSRRDSACSEQGGSGPAIAGPVSFYFDLASPYTYLAAERVDRSFRGVRWVPVTDVDAAELDAGAERAVELRAGALRMPLVWPDRTPAPARAAMRVAHLAAEVGRAAPFVLAATRLAFCGGFDVDDPSILAEAAAAAGLPLNACLAAAGDRDLDDALRAARARLAARGLDRLPALQIGSTLFAGEHRLAEAVACARGQAPLASLVGGMTPSAG